jgi:hypothetical protein
LFPSYQTQNIPAGNDGLCVSKRERERKREGEKERRRERERLTSLCQDSAFSNLMLDKL